MRLLILCLLSLTFFLCVERKSPMATVSSTPSPDFFNKYENIGDSSDGNFFLLRPSSSLIDGKYPCYEYSYKFIGARNEHGLIYCVDNKIYLRRDNSEYSDELFMDFSMKKGDTLSIKINEVNNHLIVLEDIIKDDNVIDSVFMFRTCRELPESDVVHLVSRRKGIQAIYSCFRHTSSGACPSYDEFIAFIGYGYFSASRSTQEY